MWSWASRRGLHRPRSRPPGESWPGCTIRMWRAPILPQPGPQPGRWPRSTGPTSSSRLARAGAPGPMSAGPRLDAPADRPRRDPPARSPAASIRQKPFGRITPEPARLLLRAASSRFGPSGLTVNPGVPRHPPVHWTEGVILASGRPRSRPWKTRPRTSSSSGSSTDTRSARSRRSSPATSTGSRGRSPMIRNWSLRPARCGRTWISAASPDDRGRHPFAESVRRTWTTAPRMPREAIVGGAETNESRRDAASGSRPKRVPWLLGS